MSIHRLARDLGLSISTVSRALNGYTDVAEATRQRVEQRARELDYQPHAVAREVIPPLGESGPGAGKRDLPFERSQSALDSLDRLIPRPLVHSARRQRRESMPVA